MWRRVWVLVSLVALAGLGPLAHASPPDPTYVPGLYDGAPVLAPQSGLDVIA